MEALHLHSRGRNFSRNPDPKENRSAVKAAAYRSGDRLFYNAINKTIDYTLRARGIEWAQIMLPENAPERFSDRATLWNEAEAVERRKDSLLVREFELQIPKEFTSGERINLVQEFVKANYVDQGMIADFAIHNKEVNNPNPHVHILLTTRRVTADGFEKKKERAWDDFRGQKGLAKNWRKDFARRCNELYQQKGIDRVVEYRKFTELGIDRERTIHEGKEVTALEKKGVKTDVRAKNEAIRDRNVQRELDRQAQSVIQEHSPNVPTASQFPIVFDEAKKPGLGKRILQATEKAMTAVDQGIVQPIHEEVVQPLIERTLDPLANDVAKQFGGDTRELNLSELSLPEIVERLQQMRGENKDLKSLQRLIGNYDNKVADLQYRKDNLTFSQLNSSRWLDDQIKAVEISKNQAVNSLQKDHGLATNQLSGKIDYNQAVIDKLEEIRAEMKQQKEMARSEREPTLEATLYQSPEIQPDHGLDLDF